jgi:isopentenyldiphosphate isomerase
MKKDAYYFSHDYNASNDIKCLFLRQALGMEGYGIYWFLVETLANAGGYLPLSITPVLATQMQVTEVKVRSVIANFNLFVINEDQFFSRRLIDHLETRKSLSESGKSGALKRWNNSENSHPISHPISPPNAKERKGKEIKVKEIKVKERKESDIIHAQINFSELENHSWFENIIRMIEFKIDMEKLLDYWKKFQIELTAKEDLYRTKEDYRKHFPSWVKIKLENTDRINANGKSTLNKIDRDKILKEL